MYTGYFGLSEIPFSIAPNPHYLFMSDRHREALAHLSYGLGETGGFVLLTGEVGTGKTTVSRCLLQQLPDTTQAAFILNPTLSSQELLATICDELKIRYRKTGATLKTLTDKIQQKLLKNHQAGLNTVLIIDEAQHLRAEVLEQLRLLTNLETDTKKLLQVILIGQPELQQLLQRRDLRQLAQRITARYHLLPLSKQEVARYVQHRLAVANCQQPLFSQKAIATIHGISNGIPRLINLLCDRALLGAYGANKSQVDVRLIKQAAQEALGEEYRRMPWWQKPVVKISALIITTVLMLVLGLWLGQQRAGVVQTPSQMGSVPDDAQLAAQNRSLAPALRRLFASWRINVDEALDEPCTVANTYQLSCYWYKGNLAQLLKLNYPALLKFVDGNGQAFYGTLTATDNQADKIRLQLEFEGSSSWLDNHWLEQHWQGGALVLWQAPKNSRGQFVTVMDRDSEPALWQWLEQRLSQAQQRPARQVNGFDAVLDNQLQQYQRQHGLLLGTQGEVSQETMMLLNNQVAEGLPVFNQSNTRESAH